MRAHFDDIKVLGFERQDRVTRLISKLRSNPVAKIDAPFLNPIAVQRLGRLYDKQEGLDSRIKCNSFAEGLKLLSHGFFGRGEAQRLAGPLVQ